MAEDEPTTQTGGAATAEADAPETPQLGEPAPEEEPTPEQEQPKEEPTEAPAEGDSETQAEVEPLSVEAAADAVLELVEGTELAKALQEKLGAGDEGRQRELDQERDTWERERTQEERKSLLTRAEQAVAQYMPQNVQDASRQWGDELAKSVEAAARTLLKDGEGDTGLVDASAVSQQVSNYVTGAIATWNSYQVQANADIAYGALEADEAHGHLTAEDKKALRGIKAEAYSEGLPKALSIYLAAARRSAPKVATEKAERKTVAETELADKLLAITKAIGKNGARKTGSMEPASSAGPRNETEARNWHATDRWTTRQLREYLARRNS